MIDEGIKAGELGGTKPQSTSDAIEKLVPRAHVKAEIAQEFTQHFRDFQGDAQEWTPGMLDTEVLKHFKYPPAAFFSRKCDRKDKTFHSEEQRSYIDGVTAAMAGRQVQRGGAAVVTHYDEMMIALSDSSEGAPWSLYHKRDGSVQANEGT